nr:hypothetical protein [uncultured Albidiferax sp.]
MDNITFFNRLTLALFDKLYSEFPTPVDLDVNSIAMSVIPEDAEANETWSGLQAAEDAIDFLSQEGFLTHKGSYLEGGSFLQARLTLKGLAILGSTPGSLEGKQSLIERIRKVLAGGAKEAGSEAVKLLTQQAFAAAVAASPMVIAAVSK